MEKKNGKKRRKGERDGGSKSHLPPRRLSMSPPMASVEDKNVGTFPPICRLVDTIDRKSWVRASLSVDPCPFSNEKMGANKLYGTFVILPKFRKISELHSTVNIFD